MAGVGGWGVGGYVRDVLGVCWDVLGDVWGVAGDVFGPCETLSKRCLSVHMF